MKTGTNRGVQGPAGNCFRTTEIIGREVLCFKKSFESRDWENRIKTGNSWTKTGEGKSTTFKLGNKTEHIIAYVLFPDDVSRKFCCWYMVSLFSNKILSKQLLQLVQFEKPSFTDGSF